MIFDNAVPEELSTESTRHSSFIYSVLFSSDTSAPSSYAKAESLEADDQARWGALIFGAIGLNNGKTKINTNAGS